VTKGRISIDVFKKIETTDNQGLQWKKRRTASSSLTMSPVGQGKVGLWLSIEGAGKKGKTGKKKRISVQIRFETPTGPGSCNEPERYPDGDPEKDHQ